MKTVLQLSGAAALAAFAYLCLTLSAAVRTQQKHLAATEMQLGDTIANVNRASKAWADASAQQVKSFAAIERDIRVEMWQVDRTLQAASGAIDHIGPLLDSTRATTDQATATLATAQATVQALQAPIAQANAALAALQPVEQHLDALVSDPALAATISNVASTTGHLDATAKDVQQTVHSYTHPTWAMRIWEWSLDVAHALNPL